MHALVVHCLTGPPQQHLQSPISEAWLLSCQLHEPLSKVFIRASGLIADARNRHHQKSARSPLAEGVLLLYLLDSRLHGYELHPFFRITDCSASLSKLRSATSFRKREFSSRNCLASCASVTSIPPYFAFKA